MPSYASSFLAIPVKHRKKKNLNYGKIVKNLEDRYSLLTHKVHTFL